MSVDVRTLIERVRSGDEDAFADLCEMYSVMLNSVSVSFARLGEEYGDIFDDLRQDASMALYRAALSYRLDQSAVTFGLYAKICVRNAMRSQLRKLRSRRRSAARERARAQESPEQTVITDETRRMYHELIDEVLSPFEAQVLIMTMDGLRPRKIAKELGSNAKSVSNALFRARTKLKEARGL